MPAHIPSERVLIEAFGLPGSGKTTFIERMLEESEWSTRRVLRYRDVMLPLWGVPWRKAILGPEFLFFRLRNRNLWSAAASVAASLDYAPHLIRQNKVRLLKECFFIQRALAHKSTEQAIVLDQGPIQAVWHLICYSSRINCASLKELLRRLKPWNAKCSLLLSVDSEEAVSRVTARSGKDCPFDQMAREDVSLIFSMHQHLISTVLPLSLRDNKSAVVDLRNCAAIRSAYSDLTRTAVSDFES
jgi:hypothetical protein